MSDVVNADDSKVLQSDLQEEAERAQQYLDIAGVILVALGLDGKIEFVNKRGEEVLGYTSEEIVGKDWFDNFVPESSRADVRKVFDHVAKGEVRGVAFHENSILTKNGDEIVVEWRNANLYDGKEEVRGILSSGVDVTHRKMVEEELVYRKNFESLISRISTRFIGFNSENIDDGINEALKELGEFVGVDRSYIFQFSECGKTVSNTHEWARESVEPKINDLQNLDTNVFAWVFSRIQNKEVVSIPRVEDLPPEADAEKEEFQSEEIQSLINVPLVASGRVIGFIGFDSVWKERSWDDDLVGFFKTASELFSSAIERKRSDEMLHYRTELEKLIASISSKIVNLDFRSASTVITDLIREVGEFISADRTFIRLYENSGKTLTIKHSWCDVGQKPIPEEEKVLKYGRITWIAQKLLNEEILYIPSIGSLPSEAKEEKGYMHKYNINSVLCIPFKCGQDEYGCLGLAYEKEDCALHEEEVSCLKIISELFGYALERQAAAKELEEEQMLFNALMDGTSDNIYFKDTQSRWLRVNKADAKWLGVDSPEDIIGKTDYDMFAKEHADVAYADEQSIIKTGDSVLDKEEKEVWPDGSITWVSTSKMPLRDGKGDVVGTFGISRDITAHKNANMELDKVRRLVDALMNSSPDYIYFKDVKGRFIKINRALAEFFKLDNPQDATGKKDSEYYPKETSESFYNDEQWIMENGEAIIGKEEKIVSDDGSVKWVSATTTPLYNSKGGIIGTFGVSRDITGQKLAEEAHRKLESQMQHTQKLESLGLLSGKIAHDFNNLLMGILGNTGLLLLDLPPESSSWANVKAIETVAERATDLTEQLLAYSGKSKFEMTAIDITSLVKEMADLLRVSISKKIKMEYEFSPEALVAEVDLTQIRQVMMNLITNASDAIGDNKGSIVISTGVAECDQDYFAGCYLAEDISVGQFVFFEISDNGYGIDKTTLEKIFDPFFTTKVKGHGLGLASVLGIIRGHKGALRVESQVDEGTTFRVLFPCSEKEIEIIKPDTLSASGLQDCGEIMIVDDDSVVCTVTQKMLEKQGLSVSTFKDWHEAVQKFKKSSKDVSLILLDVSMPEISGEELLLKFRKIKKDISIILISGYNEKSIGSSFPSRSYNGFIQKPYNSDRLMSKLEEVLGGEA